MKRGSKFCGYSARHFRRIIAASVKNDCELLQSLKKKEAKSCDSGDQSDENFIGPGPSKEETCSEECNASKLKITGETILPVPESTFQKISSATDPYSSSESDEVESVLSTSQITKNNELNFDYKLDGTNEDSNNEDNCVDSDESDDFDGSDDSDGSDDFPLSDFEKLESEDENDDLSDEGQCQKEENSLRDHLHTWAITYKITLVALTALLLILRLFVDATLPLDGRTLLRTPKSTETEKMSDGEFYYFGLKRAIASMLRENKQKGKSLKHLRLSVNVDGLPIFKSSSEGLWLIVCGQLNSPTVYPIATYFGVGKPDADEFLKKFVDETIEVYNFKMNNENIKVTIENVVCDTPAKAYILKLKGHTGYDSCTKCDVHGEYLRPKKQRKNSKSTGRICFPGTGPFKLKTNENFSRDNFDESESDPILKNVPGLGLVSSVPLDYMHLILLGVVKRLITLWTIGPLKTRLSTSQIQKISEKLLKLRHSCPIEFSRRPRKLSEYLHWKATEFRTFLLYTGPIVLKNIVSPEVYSHFLLLHCAITILINDAHIRIQSNIDYAEELLNEFVKDFSSIYGKEYISQNVHNLLHICADVKLFGSLDNFSSFRFENYLFSIKKMIRKGEKPLQQIARRYAEKESIAEKNVSSSQTEVQLKEPHFNGPLTEEVPCSSHQFKFYKSSSYTINCNNSKECCVLLKDGNFAVITNIVKLESGKIGFIGNQYDPIDDFYTNPNSSLFNIHIIQRQSLKSQLWFTESIESKAWKVPCQKGHIVIPLAHQFQEI